MVDGFIHHTSGMAFRNSTRLPSAELMRFFAEAMAGWPLENLQVWVRYARAAEFSGTCQVGEGRIFVNLGRHLDFPYHLGTHIARAVTKSRHWVKPIYTVELADARQLAVFLFRHECYHWLLRRARRNERQKESMCDRFAARYMVERFGCRVRDEKGRPVAREDWDFQDVDRFVAAARPRPRRPSTPGTEGTGPPLRGCPGAQLVLFND